VAGDQQGHGVGSIRQAHRPDGPGRADLDGDVEIASGHALGDFAQGRPDLLLEASPRRGAVERGQGVRIALEISAQGLGHPGGRLAPPEGKAGVEARHALADPRQAGTEVQAPEDPRLVEDHLDPAEG